MATPLLLPPRRGVPLRPIRSEADLFARPGAMEAPELPPAGAQPDLFSRPAAAPRVTSPPPAVTARRNEAKLSTARIIGGLLASILTPHIGDWILGEPQRREDRRYQDELGAQTRARQQHIDTLEMGRAERGERRQMESHAAGLERDRAYTGYLGRPQPAATVTTGEGIKQWNPQSNLYDIPVGPVAPAARTQTPVTIQTAEGVKQWNQETGQWERIGGLPKEASSGRQPSREEFLFELFTKDPAQFRQYMDAQRGRSEEVSTRELLMLRGQLASQMAQPFLPQEARQAVQQQLGELDQEIGQRRQQEAQGGAGGPGGQPGPGGPTAGSAGPAGPPAGAGGRQLDAQKAAEYLERAGGDKERARAMAREDGWVF